MSKPRDTLPDAEAREQIVHSLGDNCFVEAAAGTGKTTLMVDRILNLVRDGQTLGKIAAITFTEKAAGELKMRLREKLDEAKLDARVLAELEMAQCCTIHSFCAGILHERPVEAGVDPAFRVTDALEAEMLFDQAWKSWFEMQVGGADEEATLGGVLWRALHLDVSLDMLRQFGELLVRMRDRLDWDGFKPSGRPAADLAAEFVHIAEKLVLLSKSCKDPEDGMLERINEVAELLAEWLHLNAEQRELALLARMPEAPKSGSFEKIGAAKNWSAKTKLQDARELMTRLLELRSEAGERFVCELLNWLRGAADAYEQEKRRRSVLDFEDLLIKARDLLRKDRTVRGALQQRYERLLVDEFQDTDPVQVEIVFFLAERAPRAAEWRDVKLAPGKLFIVGDPKQSIYRFRRADIEMYEEAKAALQRQGRLERITTSFRTASPLVDWVNGVFERLIQPPESGGKFQPKYVALQSLSSRRATEPRVVVLEPDNETVAQLGEKPNVGALRRAEASGVAQLLWHLHKNPQREVTFKDEVGKLQRRAPLWSDCAVLLRNYTALDIYERVFEAHDIPFQVEGGKDYYHRAEVRMVCALLLALDNPANKIELVSVLRSPLFGVSDDDLVQWRRVQDRPLDYLADAGDDARSRNGDDSTIATAFQLLRELHGERNRYSYAAFLERCYARLKIPERFLLQPQGEQRVANLYKLVDTARAVQALEGMSLRGLARYLRDVAIERAGEGQSPTAEFGKNEEGAVSILTVHKAKGLEWGAVVLGDMVRTSAGARERLLVSPMTRLPEAKLKEWQTLGFDAARDEEQARGDAEERRLLYVACTRARDWLVLPWFSERGEYAKVLRSAFDPKTAADVERVNIADIKRDASKIRPVRVELGQPDERNRAPLEKLLAERAAWVAGRERDKEALFAGVKKLTPHELGEKEFLHDSTSEIAAGGGLEIGCGVHEALARCDLRDVEAAVKLFPAGEKFIRAALTHKLMKRVLAADECHREMPVVWQSPDGLMEGYIDLLFREGEQLIVVDYKTDAKPDPTLYAPQLAAYADALKAITGQRVAEKLLFFLSSGDVVTV
ncbi:MAG: UvrD-helicase domain-containing protein [Verrucomicrobia bacterium]|nr:UvrD-helicase domain-containing protein [Verrucomicrobiota bacterium]